MRELQSQWELNEQFEKQQSNAERILDVAAHLITNSDTTSISTI